MGQQQLILLALAVVIVGGAIVVGIRAFNENSVKSNGDSMMQDAVRMANDLQAWKQKPAPFGGQGSTQTPAIVADTLNFTGAEYGVLGYKAAGLVYTNLNGVFTLAPGVATSITGVNASFDNQIVVRVCGLTDLTIQGFITRLGGVNTGVTVACP